MSSRLLLVALALLGGCGPRALELSLSVDPACTVQIPAGGSLAYELVSGSDDPAAPPTLCGGCIAVSTAIQDSDGLLARLREAAPACNVAPEVNLRARVTGYMLEGCTSGGAAPAICAVSEAIRVGDGRSDASLAVALSCSAQCVPNGCISLSCEAQGKNCDQVPDGCGNTLQCGSCRPPEKCGGGGVPNVCSR